MTATRTASYRDDENDRILARLKYIWTRYCRVTNFMVIERPLGFGSRVGVRTYTPPLWGRGKKIGDRRAGSEKVKDA